jgi:hypothetical protein
MRRIRVGVAIFSIGASLLTGVALGANDPEADSFTGNFTVDNPNYPPPTSCGRSWLEVRDQRYVGTFVSNLPELNNRKMILDLTYFGGSPGAGVALGTVSVVVQGAFKDVLVAKGPLSLSTNGAVPPQGAAVADGFLELTFYDRGQPTPRRALGIVGATIFGTQIQGAISGSVTGRSVVWNGEMCPWVEHPKNPDSDAYCRPARLLSSRNMGKGRVRGVRLLVRSTVVPLMVQGAERRDGRSELDPGDGLDMFGIDPSSPAFIAVFMALAFFLAGGWALFRRRWRDPWMSNAAVNRAERRVRSAIERIASAETRDDSLNALKDALAGLHSLEEWYSDLKRLGKRYRRAR